MLIIVETMCFVRALKSSGSFVRYLHFNTNLSPNFVATINALYNNITTIHDFYILPMISVLGTIHLYSVLVVAEHIVSVGITS